MRHCLSSPIRRRRIAGCVSALVAGMMLGAAAPTAADSAAAVNTGGRGGLALEDSARPAMRAEAFVQAVARLRPSVVAVGAYDARSNPTIRYYGTGFVVDDGLTVATNAHVVEGLRKDNRLDRLHVFFPQPPDAAPRRIDARPARPLIEDATHDVALVSFQGPAAPAVTLLEDPPAQGQSVGVLGYPIGTALGLAPAAHRGVVAAVVQAVLPVPSGTRLDPQVRQALRDPYPLYQLDLVVYPGNSGSPLFDARGGQVVGIINKTLASRTREHLLERPSGVSYAVPAVWVRRLIERAALERELGLAPPAEPAPPAASSPGR